MSSELDWFVGNVFPDMCVTSYGLFQFSHLLAVMCLPAICITSAFLAYSMARPQLHLLLMLPAVMAIPTAWKNRKEGLIVSAVILAASFFGSLRALIPLGIGSAARSWSSPKERYVYPQSPEPITIRSNMFGIPRTFDTVHFSKFSGVPTPTAIVGQPAASLGVSIVDGTWFNESDWRSNLVWEYWTAAETGPAMFMDVTGSKYLDYVRAGTGGAAQHYRIPFAPWQVGAYTYSYLLSAVEHASNNGSIACDAAVVASVNVAQWPERAPLAVNDYIVDVWKPFPNVYVAAVTHVQVISDDGRGVLTLLARRKLFTNVPSDNRITADLFNRYRGVQQSSTRYIGVDSKVPFNFVSGLLPLSAADVAIGVPSNMTAIAYQSFLVQIVHSATSENCRAVLQDGKLRSDVYMLAAFNMTTGSTTNTILPFDVRYWTTVTCYPLISPVFVTFFVLGCILTSVSAWIMADPAHTNMYLAMSEGYEAVLGRFTNLLHKSEYRVLKVNGNFAIVLKPQNKHCQGYLSYSKAREVLHMRIKEEKKERRRAELLLRSGGLDSYRMRSKPETVFGTMSSSSSLAAVSLLE
ncbi:hypothetical protein CcCBS67573_g07442 [Chytriomyces confervae]|uniref:Uncharacterized protein n=1 Tax=Chytriomyces confervae TaxID=246404 RepID=A0A507EU67_9FUNG|nr:hypothetical protein CcCBS67573_g07442 [Chytriomyces confervae]